MVMFSHSDNVTRLCEVGVGGASNWLLPSFDPGNWGSWSLPPGVGTELVRMEILGESMNCSVNVSCRWKTGLAAELWTSELLASDIILVDELLLESAPWRTILKCVCGDSRGLIGEWSVFACSRSALFSMEVSDKDDLLLEGTVRLLLDECDSCDLVWFGDRERE